MTRIQYLNHLLTMAVSIAEDFTAADRAWFRRPLGGR